MNWEKMADSRAESKGYQVWVNCGPKAIYQVTKLGDHFPANEAGYYNLESLLRLKNVIK
jgi:hypothetical protein